MSAPSSQIAEAAWFRSADGILSELRAGASSPTRSLSLPGYSDPRELRRGGQGVVYLATQVSTKRRVAIKVLLETGRTQADTRRRFEREIDIVARLTHPNIVRIFDSGRTADGRLYFVMEFVDGAGLDELLTAKRDAFGSIETSLRVFARICDAIQYAHQHGVIHRDIKPSNVRIDPAGEPHVLDFGLAKATEDAAATQVSMTGQFMGSLPWASPEQVDGVPERMDVRSDVYSLGVMLYQTLTGGFPYSIADSLPRVFENIRTAVPQPPRQLRPEIDEELSTIILKCLAKEPDRRYQSAGDLSRDIRRFLAGEPIEAKRDSAWYAVRKTMSRYRRTLHVTAAFLAASVGASLWLGVLWKRAIVAERLAADRLTFVEQARQSEKDAHQATIAEAQKARRTAAFLDATLRFVDPWKHPGRDITPMREMLDYAAGRLPTTFADQPEVRASLSDTLGVNYWTLGLFESAETVLRGALDDARRTLGAEHAATLALMYDLGSMLTERGKHNEAEPLLRELLDVYCRTLGPENPRTLSTMNNLAYDIDWQGRVSEAAELYRLAHEGQARVLGPLAVDTLHSANNLAIALQTLGEPEEAERLMRQTIEGRSVALGISHPETLQARMNLARMVADQGRLSESLEMFAAVVDELDATVDPGHPLALAARGNLGDTLASLGQYDEALRMNQETYEAQVHFSGADNPTALLRLNQVMCNLIDLKRNDEAIEVGRGLRDAMSRVVGPGDLRTLTTAGNLAFVLNLVGRSEEAVTIWNDIVAEGTKALGPDSQPVITARTNLAQYFADQKRYADAEANYRTALEVMERLQQGGHWRAAVMRSGLGRVQLETGRLDEAEQSLLSAYGVMHETFGDAHDRTQRVLGYVVRLYEARGDAERAEEYRRRLVSSHSPAAH